MAGDRMQPRALGQFALDIGDERQRRLFRRGERRRLAEQQRIDGQKPPRLLIGGASHHHAVDVRQLRLRLLQAADAAIEHDGEIRVRNLEPVHDGIVERRHLAIFARRQSLQPGFARVHDQRIGARRLHRRGKGKQRLIRILLVDADPAFHRHRNLDRRFHGGDAIGDQRRLRHQAGAEAALLHPVGRTADIEIDLVVAELFADARRLRQAPPDRCRRAAARPDARTHRSRAAARGRRAAPRRW